MSKDTNYKGLFMLTVIVVAAIAGYMASNQYFNGENNGNKLEFESLLVYPKQKTFSGFKLTDKNMLDVTIESFSNKWTLLFFGFTHCPDVCPTTLSELQKVFNILQSKDIKTMPEVLFVSVDPERDNPQLLKEYISFFNPDFNAATGDAANILAITSQVGVAYHIGDHKKDEKNYSVDHTAAIFLVDPNKNLYGIFRSPHQADKIVNDLTQLMGGK